jgi:putative membrane protein
MIIRSPESPEPVVIHYETKSWVSILLRLRGTVLPRVVLRTFLVVAVAFVVTYVHQEGIRHLATPDVVHTTVGVALGLLLVFRTNASYDRYWEGRKLLGALVNASRDLARQTASYLAPTATAEREAAARYLRALYVTIRHYLRHERESPELDELLTAEERRQLAATRAPPLRVARLLSDVYAREAAAGRLSEERLHAIDLNITRIIDQWGGAERILKTPVPFAYAHHIKLFLILWVFTVPLALLATLGWLTPLGAGLVAFSMFGIDEIGVEIEDPFGYDANDLPLDDIGRTLDEDLVQTTAL